MSGDEKKSVRTETNIMKCVKKVSVSCILVVLQQSYKLHFRRFSVYFLVFEAILQFQQSKLKTIDCKGMSVSKVDFLSKKL